MGVTCCDERDVQITTIPLEVIFIAVSPLEESSLTGAKVSKALPYMEVKEIPELLVYLSRGES